LIKGKIISIFSHFSSLRGKVLLALSIGMLLLFGLVFFVARNVLLEAYSKLEADKTTIQINSAISLINEQAQQLSISVINNAHWDDIYYYMDKPSVQFTDSTMNATTHAVLKVNVIFIADNNGEVVFKSSLDYKTGKPLHIPSLLSQEIRANSLLIDTKKPNISGLFWTQEGIYIVSSVDILNGVGKGSRKGTLIMARLLDDELTARIGKIVDTELNIHALSDEEINSIAPNLLNNQKVIKAFSNGQVGGFALLESINADYKLTLSTAGNREIFQQGQSSLKFLYWASLLAALLLGAFSWLFNRLVLTRLNHLNDDIKQIGESATTSGRIENIQGNDELNSLARGINGMLAKLDQSQQALQFEKERAQVTLSSIADAVITSNVHGQVLYMNTAAERLTELESSYAAGKSIEDLFYLMTVDKTTKVNSAWLTNANSIVDEVLLTRSDGQEFIISKSASPLHDQNGVLFGTVTVLHDVTILHIMSNQLSHQARYDALTGLANRYEFDRKAQAAIDDTSKSSLTHCIAYVDLDKFKLVNDSCGHMAGDLLLKKLAIHMQAKLRGADTLARLGGDEFALLLMACRLDKAQEIANDLLKSIQAFRFEYDNKVFKVGASIGLTEISPNQSLGLSELLAAADSACYAAKQDGGNNVFVYQADDDNMKEKHNLLSWVSRINLGIENNQFVLFSQPIKGLHKNAEPHCELLIRMKGEDAMLYPPSVFLPAAERYHLMPQIDRWVINEALSIIAKKGIDAAGVYAINLSGQSLSQDGFLEYVSSKINEYNINARRICFEITETAVISNLDVARQFMQALRAKGCRFSLDDFGSGLSSFAYLKNLEVDFLKIDGMFVRSILSNKIDRAMVESINNVGHVMGLHTIAEFAENQEIIDVLKEIGVDYVQGYGVAMPAKFD
jgi:diguanylate cyclase (GGDEF)-like protein/PAS domain S-box-containing protein